MKIITLPAILLIMLFISCQNKEAETNKKVNYPSHNYTYVNVDTTTLKYKGIVYVPVYSDICHLDETKRFLLTTTVSIRNISLKDSTYVLNEDNLS